MEETQFYSQNLYKGIQLIYSQHHLQSSKWKIFLEQLELISGEIKNNQFFNPKPLTAIKNTAPYMLSINKEQYPTLVLLLLPHQIRIEHDILKKNKNTQQLFQQINDLYQKYLK